MTQREVEASLAQFEGLVRETARQIHASGVELDEEDICQLIRIKVWHAVEKFSASRAAASRRLSADHSRTPLQRYVFMCVANLRKDFAKRSRRYDRSIEQMRSAEEDEAEYAQRADRFDARYLSVEHDEVFAAVEQEPFALPATLSRVELRIVRLRLDGMVFLEIDRTLRLSRIERQQHVASVRAKLADWQPTRRAPLAPLPGITPRAVSSRV